MKKYLLLLASAALLLVGCAKEKFAEPGDGGLTNVTISACIDGGVATRALADNDGKGANVNRCIMEIYFQDQLYKRMEAAMSGTPATATFANVPVVAGKEYQVLFWADHGGDELVDKYYTTKTEGEGNKGLKAVTVNGTAFKGALEAGKNDELDAFFGADKYTVGQTTNNNFNITLYRPFAQLNVITTDVAAGKTVTSDDLLPDKVSVSYKADNTINVATGETSKVGQTEADYTFAYEAPVYGETDSWSDVKNRGELTLSMDYILASIEQGAVDVTFKTKNGENVVMSHSLANLPYQRNYRTNVKGDLLTAAGSWKAEITPAWTGETTHPVVIATTLAEAQAAFGPASGGEAASTVIVKPEAVTNRNTAEDKEKSYVESKTLGITLPEGAKAIEFVLTPQSQKDVTFELPALPADTQTEKFYWYIRHEANYPTKNLNVKVSDNNKTRVIIDAPDETHVVLNDVEYEHVIAFTGENTLVVPTGITVDKLTVKQGGVEIHGKVDELEVAPADGKNVYFRACEGLSATVFEKIYKESDNINYIDPMYTYAVEGEVYNIYKLPVVAMIGKTEYPSIAAALNAVKANETIDVVTESIELPALNKADVTVKGNGETKVTAFGGLTGKNVTLDGFEFTVQTNPSGENFTIKNSRFTGTNGLRYAYANGNVLIENCVFDTDTYGIHFDGNSGKVIVKDCEIVGFNTFNPCLTFDNCKFVDSKKGNKYYVVQSWSDIVLKNCSFSEKWCDANDYQTIGLTTEAGLAEIINCTFAVGTVYDACKNSELGVIAIDATGNATDGFTAGTFVAKQASDIKAAPSYVVYAVVGKENVWTIGGPYEARIGQVYFTKLQDAVDAVQTGETITLLCNIDSGFYGIEQVLQKDFSIDSQGSLHYMPGTDYSIDWNDCGYRIRDLNTNLLYYNNATALYGTTAFTGETLVVPEGITDIAGNKRFKGSTTLKNVKLSSTVTKLWNRFFANAASLERIYYKDGNEYVEGLSPYLTVVEDAIFMSSGLKSPIAIPASMTEVPADLFRESHIASVSFPEGVTAIGANAFNQIAELTEVTIPSTLRTIGNQAFRNCTNLKTINLLFETVPETIGSYTFNAVSAAFGATTPGVIYVKNQAVADALWNVFDSNAKNYYSIKNYDDHSTVYYKGLKIE